MLCSPAHSGRFESLKVRLKESARQTTRSREAGHDIREELRVSGGGEGRCRTVAVLDDVELDERQRLAAHLARIARQRPGARDVGHADPARLRPALIGSPASDVRDGLHAQRERAILGGARAQRREVGVQFDEVGLADGEQQLGGGGVDELPAVGRPGGVGTEADSVAAARPARPAGGAELRQSADAQLVVDVRLPLEQRDDSRRHHGGVRRHQHQLHLPRCQRLEPQLGLRALQRHHPHRAAAGHCCSRRSLPLLGTGC